MAHVDPNQAQTICGNVFWIESSVGDIYLSNLEQNTQQEQGKKGDEDNPLAFISKGQKIQRPCNKVTDYVQPEARTKTLWQIWQAHGWVIDQGGNCNAEKPCKKDDFCEQNYKLRNLSPG